MKRRILSVLLVLTMVVGMVPLLPVQVEAAEATSGTCGDNLTWNLDENGTLTISGTGDMKDYRLINTNSDLVPFNSPWCSQRSSIKNVHINNGVTSIGSMSFVDCVNLANINIPNSVTSIGRCAFGECTSLTSITIPNSVTSIEDFAFSGCTSLTSITIPNSVTSIEGWAFSDCTSLRSLRISSSVITIWHNAFGDCSNLNSIFFDGYAPEVPETSDFPVFPANTTLYYIPGKYGWTTPRWEGYKTDTWDGYTLSSITPIDFGEIEINYSGEGYANFMVTDDAGNPLPGARFRCDLYNAQQKKIFTKDLVSDGNGILSVETPTIASDTEFTLLFTPSNNSIKFNGLKQTVKVKVKHLSYEQTWEGMLHAGGDVGFSVGSGGKLGTVSMDSTLLKAMIGGDLATAVTIKDSMEDGSRTLELNCETSDLSSLGIKAGIDASNCNDLKFELIGASGKIATGKPESMGLKIKNYDPINNPSQMETVGKMALLMTLMTCRQSRLIQQIMGNPSMAVPNQYGNSAKVSVEYAASALTPTLGKEKLPLLEGSFAGRDSSSVYTFAQELDGVDDTKTYRRSAVYSEGSGLVSSLEIGDSVGAGNYLLGLSRSNHKEFSATKNGLDYFLKELSYKTYDGEESSTAWFSDSTDQYATVKYSENAAQNLIKGNNNLKQFSEGDLTAIPIQDAIDIMSTSNEFAQIEETSETKTGMDIDLSLGAAAGLSADGTVGFSGKSSYSYTTGTSVRYNGTVYPVTHTGSYVKNSIKLEKKDLSDLFAEPIHVAWKQTKNIFDSAVNSIKKGVKHLKGKLEGVADWFGSLSTVRSKNSKRVQSYAILSLEDEGTPNSDAALSVTLGDPYLVEVYTDESQETLVTDEQLAASPLTLTLEYTDEMLKAAGATAETDVKIYHYDAERNVYVCLPESNQDREAKSVTAQITQQGEYILAVDTAAPCVSDFKPSDGTAKPTLTALVSDLSGLKDFSFWIDGNQNSPLVTKENLKDYYVEKTGVFTYTMTKDLAVGEHTAYFMAEDTLGNRLTEPVSFTFTVQDFSVVLPAPAVPSETVRDGCFTVKTPAPTDGSVEGMTLVLETEDGRLVSIPMTLENDTWTAEVTDLSGSGTLKVYTIAADAYGNTVESKKQEVKVEEDEEEVTVTSLALGDLLSLDGKAGVKVNVTNGEEGAISALLNVAFYDEKGKQLDVVQTGVGLTGHETQTYTVGGSVSSNQVAKIKAFLLDCADGYTPLCTPVGK